MTRSFTAIARSIRLLRGLVVTAKDAEALACEIADAERALEDRHERALADLREQLGVPPRKGPA